ncbi:hypothetical protein BJV74DRAFT_880388 [Russula compacta]|nr:hypothetical protein BJV74DRAFT_880388 [Russula compacta]
MYNKGEWRKRQMLDVANCLSHPARYCALARSWSANTNATTGVRHTAMLPPAVATAAPSPVIELDSDGEERTLELVKIEPAPMPCSSPSSRTTRQNPSRSQVVGCIVVCLSSVADPRTSSTNPTYAWWVCTTMARVVEVRAAPATGEEQRAVSSHFLNLPPSLSSTTTLQGSTAAVAYIKLHMTPRMSRRVCLETVLGEGTHPAAPPNAAKKSGMIIWHLEMAWLQSGSAQLVNGFQPSHDSTMAK